MSDLLQAAYAWAENEAMRRGPEDVKHLRVLAEAVKKEMQTCRWTYDETHDKWDTGCDTAWQFMDIGGPDSNGVNYCFRCGRKIETDTCSTDNTNNQKTPI